MPGLWWEDACGLWSPRALSLELMLCVCGSAAHGVSACVSSTHGCTHGGSLPPCRAHGLAPGSHSRIWSSAAHRPPGTRTLPVTGTKRRPRGLPLQEPHTVPDQV